MEQRREKVVADIKVNFSSRVLNNQFKAASNKLAKLRRQASRVHFAKIHFGKGKA